MEPLVTIIMPTLNIIENEQIDAFNMCISLLDIQTYPNFEILVIDNNSADGTVDLLRDYKNQGFLNFYSERDTGKYSAFNKGIMRTKARYVAFLSCDDFFHDITAIASVVSVMEEHQADYLVSNAYCRHPEGFTFLFQPAIYNVFQTLPCARQGMFFRRATLESMNYFYERFKLMSDLDLIIRLLMNRARGIRYEGNFTTYKLSHKAYTLPENAIEETKLVFSKNYRNFYPMNEEVLDEMVRFSKFPQPLLERLSQFFPPEEKGVFFERCEQMHQIKLEAYRNSKR